MRLEETKAGSLGQAGQQRPIVTRQPAIEGVAYALRHAGARVTLHWPETGLRVFGVWYLVRDLAK